MPNQSSSAGFTLIELLLVISILSILATIVLVAINPVKRINEARDSGRKQDLAQISHALEAYAAQHNGLYPAGGPSCDDCGNTYDANKTQYSATDWIPSLIQQNYLKLLPKDPDNGLITVCQSTNAVIASAGYVYYSTGTDYKIIAYCSPSSGLNSGTSAPPSPYCSNTPNSPPYDASIFSPSSGATALKSLVDPRRPSYAYAIYTPGLTCY